MLPLSAAIHFRNRLVQTIALALCCAPILANASVLNWPAGGWTAGAPGIGQTFTQSFTANAPNDVTVAVNNTGATWNATYPKIDSTTATGGFSGVQALQLFVTGESTTSTYLKVTVSFASPVTNLSFQLWDVDASPGQFIDKISNIQGLTPSSTAVGPTSVTSAVSGFNSITGSGLTTVITGTAGANNSTNQGTIDITFAGQITQFSFEWYNTDAARGQQAIGLGPLTFTFVPEYSVGPLAALFCAIALTLRERSRRAKTRV